MLIQVCPDLPYERHPILFIYQYLGYKLCIFIQSIFNRRHAYASNYWKGEVFWKNIFILSIIIYCLTLKVVDIILHLSCSFLRKMAPKKRRTRACNMALTAAVRDNKKRQDFAPFSSYKIWSCQVLDPKAWAKKCAK